MSVKRPILRYHGGKWKLAPWIIANMPEHAVYVEPFGGGGSVLLRKERLSAECYNDLDGQIVNVFRVLQDPGHAAELCQRILLVPFARAEFERTYTPPKDAIERACFTIMRSFMGFGSDSNTRKHRTGFRSMMTDERILPAANWRRWPESVVEFVDRLRGVVIEERPAIEVILRMDRKQTCFYVDPPYVTSTRSTMQRGTSGRGYAHEMTDADHSTLAEVLRNVKGMVLLSGYRCTLYDELYEGWNRLDRDHLADGARKRTESLWFNPAAWARRPQVQMFNRQEEVA